MTEEEELVGIDRLIDAKLARRQFITADDLLARPAWLRLRDAAARLLMPYL